MGDFVEPIRVRGLNEFVRNLRKIDKTLPKELKAGLNEAAGVVVQWAQPRVPMGATGKARRSVRAKSTARMAQVTGGGARVPYYPWLDFGGRVGRKRSVVRPFDKGGRYIYPGYAAKQDEVQALIVEALVRTAEVSDLGVD